MSLAKDFKDFAVKGNVIDMAVGVVIGAAFGKIVAAFVEDLIMPLVSGLTSQAGGDWRNATVSPLNLKIGHLAGTIVDFVIVAFVIFLVVVKVMGSLRKPVPAPPAPPTKTCGECLETIPLAAKRCRACTAVLAALVLSLLPSVGRAQDPVDPKFGFAKPEDVQKVLAKPDVEWTAQVKGGVVNTTGNSRTLGGTLGAAASRKAGSNKLALDVTAAYGQSDILVARDTNMNKAIDTTDELGRDGITSTNNWATKGRYDRFLSDNNAVYGSAQIAADKIAGKKLFGGGQVGYSRQLVKNDGHTLVGEVGYDFSYESYVSVPVDAFSSVQVHSARLFFGELWKLSSETGVYGNAEVLFNLNKERALKANDGTSPVNGVSAFKDTRVVGKAGLTTTLWKNVSFGFGLLVKYDQNPAPRPTLKGFTYATGFQPFSDKLDTAAEATLIVSFL